MTRGVSLLLLLCFAELARAADPGLDDLQGLLETPVVSSASLTHERADDAPATVTLITADQLKRLGLRSLHEAINFLSVGMFAQDPLHAVGVGSRGVLLSSDYGNHVLVVEDSPVARTMLVRLLKSLGYTADEAENGQQAVDKVTAALADPYLIQSLSNPISI